MLIGVKGEAGMGKSRLVDEFLKGKPELPFYLHGAAPRVAPPPFCIFTSLIRKHFGISQIEKKETIQNKLETGLEELAESLYDKEEREHLRNHLPILGYLLGVKYDDIRLQLEPKELRPHIYTAIRFFLEALAAKANRQSAPLVIVFEDLQWLDEPSASVLTFLMFTLNLEEKRKQKNYKHLLILLNYRSEWKPSKRLRTDADFHELDLNAIDQASGKELIQSMVKELELPETTLKTVMERSEGNPFYIEEWVNLIIESPELKRKEELPIPNTLNALVLSRIDRLEENLKLLLQKASVLGREFFVKTLEEMEKKLECFENISSHLDYLENNDFVLPLPDTKISAYLFKHIITQEVAYNTLLKANRKVLHRIAGEVIEEVFTDNIEDHWRDLAEHFEKAEVWDKAGEYLLKAANMAGEAHDNQLALNLCNSLLQLFENHPEISTSKSIVEVQLRKGRSYEKVGHLKKALILYQEAVEISTKIDNQRFLARAMNLRGNVLSKKGDFNEAMINFRKVLDIYKQLNVQLGISNAIGNIGIIYMKKGDYKAAGEYYKDQLSIIEQLGHKGAVSNVYSKLGVLLNYQSQYDQALEYFYKELSIAEELKDIRRLSGCYGNIGAVLYQKGDNNRAIDFIKKQQSLSEEIGDKIGISTSVFNLGMIYNDQGDYEKALECYKEKLSISESAGDNVGIASSLVYIGEIYNKFGDYNGALQCHRKAISVCEKYGGKREIADAYGRIAHVYYSLGDLDNALYYFQKALHIEEKLGDRRSIAFKSGNIGLLYYDLGEYKIADEMLTRAEEICREIKLEKVLAMILRDRAKIALELESHESANNMIKESQSLANQIEDADEILQIRIVSYKLNFVNSEENEVRKAAKDSLEALLWKTDSDERRAEIRYELWLMHTQLDDRSNSDSHRGKALKLYQESYKKIPKFEFKKRIEELESRN